MQRIGNLKLWGSGVVCALLVVWGLSAGLASGPGAAGSRAASAALPCPPAWHLVAGADLRGNTAVLNAVAAFGPDDAWAVGGATGYSDVGGTLTEHWNGQSWTLLPGPGGGFLNGVAGSGPQDIWAVGQTIIHWDGAVWQAIPYLPPPDPSGARPPYTLNAVAALSPTDAWAAGGISTGVRFAGLDALLIHWDGVNWVRWPNPPGSGVALRGLAFAGPNDAWVVGIGSGVSAERTFTAHWDGLAWQTVPSPNLGQNSTILSGVSATGPHDVWAVGSAAVDNNSPNRQQPVILHWNGTRWSVVSSPNPGDNGGALFAVSARGANDAWAVGSYKDNGGSRNFTLHWDGRAWQLVPSANLADVRNELYGVAAAGPQNVWAVGSSSASDGTVLTWYSPECGLPTPVASAVPPIVPTPIPTPTAANPAARVPDPRLPNVDYFPVAGHSLQGGFRVYWRAHGGLAQFGYPLTEEFQEAGSTPGPLYTVQYFERARFEWHPENRPPYDVLLGLLGRTITAGRAAEPAFQPAAPSGVPGSLYFPATQHNLAPEFVSAWTAQGGLPVYGYPISEAFQEVSPTDGQPYLVQYFERNRFEYHPELPAPYRVSLGLLGVQVLQQRGWLP